MVANFVLLVRLPLFLLLLASTIQQSPSLPALPSSLLSFLLADAWPFPFVLIFSWPNLQLLMNFID